MRDTCVVVVSFCYGVWYTTYASATAFNLGKARISYGLAKDNASRMALVQTASFVINCCKRLLQVAAWSGPRHR